MTDAAPRTLDEALDADGTTEVDGGGLDGLEADDLASYDTGWTELEDDENSTGARDLQESYTAIRAMAGGLLQRLDRLAEQGD